MEFYEKLQILRKKKGLTQDALAEGLYVSRTAISKWESGRGYPNIDSLKAIAKFFSISIDELLSGDELLTIVEADGKQKEQRTRDAVFGVLDICAILLLFLPFFGEKVDGVIRAVSLLALAGTEMYLRACYLLLVFGLALLGLCTLALRNWGAAVWLGVKSKLSVVCNLLAVVVFVISLQPYAAVYLLTFLVIKVMMLIRWK